MDATAGESFNQVVRPITPDVFKIVRSSGEIRFACLQACPRTIGFQYPRLEATGTTAALESKESKPVAMTSSGDREREVNDLLGPELLKCNNNTLPRQ